MEEKEEEAQPAWLCFLFFFFLYLLNVFLFFFTFASSLLFIFIFIFSISCPSVPSSVTVYSTFIFSCCLVEQPAIVILCQQHECQDNETVDMFQNITCMANSLENEVIEMQLNGVSVGVGENNYTHNIVQSPTNGTLLLVVCNTSSDYNDTVSVQIHVGNVGRLLNSENHSNS